MYNQLLLLASSLIFFFATALSVLAGYIITNSRREEFNSFKTNLVELI